MAAQERRGVHALPRTPLLQEAQLREIHAVFSGRDTEGSRSQARSNRSGIDQPKKAQVVAELAGRMRLRAAHSHPLVRATRAASIRFPAPSLLIASER